MNRIQKCLMGMLYQRAEILAEYEPGERIRDAYIEAMARIRNSGKVEKSDEMRKRFVVY